MCMKKFTVIISILIISACSSKSDKNRNDLTEILNYSVSKTIVSVKKVEYEKFEHFTEITGTTKAVQFAFISPEMSGQIKSIYINEGEKVKKGQLLVSLNADVIENSIDELETGLELATIIYNRQKDLWEKEIGSEIQFLEAKSNKESLEKKLKTLNSQLEMTRVKAPFNGIVEKIFQKEGELGTPGRQLVQLINLHKLYVNAEISESYISSITKGMPVIISLPSYPEIELKAEIHRTGNIINAQSRTFLIQMLISNRAEIIKPNSLAVLRIKDFSADSAFVVPTAIIKKDIKGYYLYTIDNIEEKQIARKTYIQKGMFNANNTIVVEGLTKEQQVITIGYNLVTDGDEIEIVK